MKFEVFSLDKCKCLINIMEKQPFIAVAEKIYPICNYAYVAQTKKKPKQKLVASVRVSDSSKE